MKIVGVIGTGTMGCGIAQIAAQSGYEVIFQNRRQESVDRGLASLRKNLERLVAKEKLTQTQCNEALALVRGAVPLAELKGCDIVIESAPEDLALKQSLFEALDPILGDNAVIATNTSSLSVTKLASFVSRPGTLRRDALLQPGAGDEARRAGEGLPHHERHHGARAHLRRGARQAADRGEGRAGLRREPRAVPDDQRSGLRARRGRRRRRSASTSA